VIDDQAACANIMPPGTKIRLALEAAGVEFIDENGGGPGARLRHRQQKKS
jgi:hypothetical protein